MADGEFNVAKGRTVELYNRVQTNDPASSGIVLILLQAAEADGALEKHETLQDLLAAAGNTICNFTNFTRIELTDANLAALVTDQVNNWNQIDLDDQTISSAGGAQNNTTAKVIICYDPNLAGGDDSEIIPMTHHDFVETTDGTDLVIEIDNFYRGT